MTRLDKIELLVWTLMVASPLFSLLRPLWRRLQTGQWRTTAFYLFVSSALPITLYGMATDGEIKEVECGMLLAAGLSSLLVLNFLAPIFAAFMLQWCSLPLWLESIWGQPGFGCSASARTNSLSGGTRNVPVANKFFKDTYASPLMRDVIEQVEVAKSAKQGTLFLRPQN